MSEKDHSSSLNENDEVSSDKSKTKSTKKDKKNSQFHGNRTAISPDGKQIVTFNPETSGIKLYGINNLSNPIGEFKSDFKNPCWSLAISDCVNDDERLIALSCFDSRTFIHDDDKTDLESDGDGDDENDLESGGGDDENDLESGGGDDKNDLESGVGDKVNTQYGYDEFDPQTWVISTADGNEIYTSLESIGGIKRFKPLEQCEQFEQFEQFELPHQLSKQLKRHSHDKWQGSFKILQKSIIKNHFMVHSFENRHQIIEMYSLITGDLEMLFKRHESSSASDIIRGSPILAISQNEKILAFCRGTSSITLYSIENGLEITTKQLKSQSGIHKILDINFIDADNKLLIILEEKEDRHLKNSKNHQIFVVWDLFTTFENSIRQTDYPKTKKPLKMDLTYRLMNSHGKVFAIRDSEGSEGSEDIFSVLDPNEDVDSIRNPSKKAKTEVYINSTNDHVFYNIDGKSCDQLAQDQIITNNVEPWHSNENYFRLSVFLDSSKSTQLSISHNTIQVWKWKYLSNNKRERVLEYIRARNKEMEIQELRVGEREFELRVSVPSKELHTPKIRTIHWPNNVNVLEAACRTLFVLGKKKHSITCFTNVNQMKYLVECTQKLVRKYIMKYGIFRLTSIRYLIMKYLIKNEKSSTTERSKSDLHHAIKCIQERGNSTVILKYLIDYYADNSKEYNNYGWMFTVSKAIPLLYEAKLNEFVQYLFKKPCFGITEAYTPPLHITSYDIKRGNNASVMHSLVVKPRLATNFHYTSCILRLYYWFKTSQNDRKVYMVPLPDFTANPKSKDSNSKDPKDSNPKDLKSKILWVLYTIFWPRKKVINKKKEMSPFLRVINEEKGYEIYRTPAIMAVLDLKWKAAQIVQLKRGVRKYMRIYNIIDLLSILLPLVNYIAAILNDHQILILRKSVYNSFLAFTALVLWLELILLMRFFIDPARFIYIIGSILRTIWPFFAFMLIVDDLILSIPTYKINDTSNSGLYSNITIYQDIDKSSWLDNYYSNPFLSIEAVFFWTNGRWDQLSQWDNYVVNALSVLGSIILVLIFQNLLIAFMNGEFDKASEAGRTVAYKHRADLVADYEVLQRPFSDESSDPRYIYYIPDPGMIHTWLTETEKDEEQKARLMVVTSKLKTKDASYNKICNEPLNVDEKINNLENEFKKFDEKLETILKTLNNLNNSK
ncbi:3148_t:CDS:10 [Diversispora eburnea]|uniref:3148_t:CDS:1 n=1 Tax=Diversispora eburnea TaxID=1213867 RepID=A0A9N9C0Q6_9GLOM|nr:3148_t:CDS:10 [Diversispora eburnea]